MIWSVSEKRKLYSKEYIGDNGDTKGACRGFYLHPLMRVSVACPTLSELNLTIDGSNLKNGGEKTHRVSEGSSYFPLLNFTTGNTGVPFFCLFVLRTRMRAHEKFTT